MSVVGTVDVLLAGLVLVRPLPLPLAWMTFWATFTALLRPLSGGSWLDFIERGANIGAPLALLLLILQTRRPAGSVAPGATRTGPRPQT